VLGTEEEVRTYPDQRPDVEAVVELDGRPDAVPAEGVESLSQLPHRRQRATWRVLTGELIDIDARLPGQELIEPAVRRRRKPAVMVSPITRVLGTVLSV
jgi:hypothetical protein